jgi:predicted alpha/beta-hydrolase family hydrolase
MKRKIKIQIPEPNESITGIIQYPKAPKAMLLLAHGAGAGMEHIFMESIASLFEQKNIGTLRFNFLYKEKGGKRPDRPKVAHQAINAAFKRALSYATKFNVQIYVGGKSFGGRMTSQLLSEGGLKESKGIIFFGFPLHAPGKPSMDRADHLSGIRKMMLFHQGTRDALADIKMVQEVTSKLKKAKLNIVEGADHGFKTLKSSNISHESVLEEIVNVSSQFIR